MANKTTLTKKLFLLVDKLFYRSQNPRAKTAEALKGLAQLTDITFAPGEESKLDVLFRPRSDGKKYPVVFVIHGGGFSAGDKAYRQYFCAQIAKRTGALVVNVNHPLGPENPCPIPLQSLVRAFNWAIRNADLYKMDTSRMLVTGDSSGAYYAAMLSMIPDHPDLQKIYGRMAGRFSSAVYICGVYDIDYSLNHRLPFGITTGICVDISGKKPKDLSSLEYTPYLSPIDFVTEHHPKTLLIYAKKDFFAKGQAELLMEAFREKGVPYEEYHSTRLLDNHDFILNGNSLAAKRSRKVMYDYMRKVLCDDPTRHTNKK